MGKRGEVYPDLKRAGADRPDSRPVKPLAHGEKHDQLAEKAAGAENRQEALLDEALKETFPGSDPISPMRIA